MSSVISSATPIASGASCSTADFTQFPTTDVACAVGSTTGIPSNTSDIFSACCKSAPVEDFNDKCGYYCLSIQQTVAELQACFMKEGASPSSIFCSGNNTATATSKPTSSGGATASGSKGSGTATSSSGAAQMSPCVSKAGLGMLGMVVASALAGALL